MTAVKPIIIAHRGASDDAPENTLASVNLAWELGADAVEVDVQLSSDNRIVVIHDYNTKRVGDRNELVKAQTFEELQELDVGSWKGEKWKDEKIPLLRDVLLTLPEDKKLVVEIKCGVEITDELIKVVQNSGHNSDQIVFISFNPEVCASVKKAMPDYKVLLLSEMDYTWLQKIFRPSVDKLIETAKRYNLDGLDLWCGGMINSRLARKCKQNDLLLYTWTVNSSDKARKLIELEVDGITTDKVKKFAGLVNNIS